jgi:hypothetical protein
MFIFMVWSMNFSQYQCLIFTLFLVSEIPVSICEVRSRSRHVRVLDMHQCLARVWQLYVSKPHTSVLLENDSKMMHPGTVKIGARPCAIGARFSANSGSMSYVKNRRPKPKNRGPICRSAEVKKRLFSWAGSVLFGFLRDAFHYKYKPCIRWLGGVEKQGLEANKQTRVYREFSWQQH